MNFLEFQEKMRDFPYFETKELKVVLGDDFTSTALYNLKNWVKKGSVLMLRRGFYCLASAAKKETEMIAFSTKLYAPSYVSMESALSFYGIIPEAVFTATSVTTRKTKRFKTPVGNFQYRKIKKQAFGGFETRSEKGISFNLALPEKAVVDFLYLNRNILDGSREEFLGYRFNEDFSFDAGRLIYFAEVFGNKKVLLLTQNFIKQYVAK